MYVRSHIVQSEKLRGREKEIEIEKEEDSESNVERRSDTVIYLDKSQKPHLLHGSETPFDLSFPSSEKNHRLTQTSRLKLFLMTRRSEAFKFIRMVYLPHFVSSVAMGECKQSRLMTSRKRDYAAISGNTGGFGRYGDYFLQKRRLPS